MAITRLRGRRLQARRTRLLAASPLCAACGIHLATELDHIKPLHQGGEDTESNLQGLCSKCHEAKTQKDCGYTERKVTGLDGWPVEPTKDKPMIEAAVIAPIAVAFLFRGWYGW